MFAKLGNDKLKKHTTLKTNLLTKLKEKAVKQMPPIAAIIDDLFPKKTPVVVYSVEQHVKLYSVDNKPVMVEIGSGQVFPMLRTVIDYPGLLPTVYVDDGAVKALLRGAQLKAPGIKKIENEFSEGDVIQVRLLDCEYPFMVGLAKVSSSELGPGKTGDAVETLTILKDALYVANEGLC